MARHKGLQEELNMGTNYYLHRGICPECKRSCDHWHIGKSSIGWCFSLHIIPERGIRDLPDWVQAWQEPDTLIRDEYGRDITPEAMLDIITNRKRPRPPQWKRWYASIDEYYARNDAEPGPNHLLRHRIGHHCVGHGEGTWDLIQGEF